MLQMNQAGRQVVVALTKLKTLEMQPLVEFFHNMATDTDVALRRAKPDDFQRLQGRAQLLEEVLTAIEQSSAVLERMR